MNERILILVGMGLGLIGGQVVAQVGPRSPGPYAAPPPAPGVFHPHREPPFPMPYGYRHPPAPPWDARPPGAVRPVPPRGRPAPRPERDWL